MNQSELFITITGFKHYYGLEPFQIGHLIRCKKDPDNRFDDEAIRCSLPGIGTVGYIANAPTTTAGGTRSAGRIYDSVPEKFYVRVRFTTFTKVICEVIGAPTDELDAELAQQVENEDW